MHSVVDQNTRWAFLPALGANATGPACDGTIDVGQVGVVPSVIPGAHLQAHNLGQYSACMHVDKYSVCMCIYIYIFIYL